MIRRCLPSWTIYSPCRKNSYILLKRIFNMITIKALNIMILLGLLMAACTPANPAGAPATSTPPSTLTQPVSREAQVQSVEIQTLGTAPAQVNAVVHGILPESCAALGESHVQYTSYKFRITVYTVT